jgi:hypothetical protein
LDARGAPEPLGVDAVERVGHVGLAGLDHQCPRRRVGDAAHDQDLDVRHAPPVAGIGLQFDFDTGLVADEFVRAGADRVLLEPVVADFGQVLLGHDDTGGGGGGAVEGHEIGPRRLQVEAHGQRIDDFDLLDVILQGLRSRALVALEAELHVLGRQRVAVVKLQARAQLELVGQAVLALLPALGEARAHLLARIGAHERIVDRVEHAERRDLRRRGRRIEPGRRNRHVPSDDDPSRRRRGTCIRWACAKQQDGREKRSERQI